jgi:hypothetical protein
VAAFVKNDPALSHIPVLLLTGAFEPVDEARASAVRCDGVLAKPFEPQLLIGRVKELLGTGTAHEPPEASALAAAAAAPEPQRDDDDTGPLPQVPGGFTAEDFSLDTASIGDPGAATPAGDVSLDDYFDRLDAAFASLSGAPAGQLKNAVAGGAEDTSWAPPSAGGWSPADSPGVATAEQAVSVPATARDAPPPISAVVVPVADAFAALLEAEQHGAAISPAPMEVTMPAVPVGATVVTDALVDAVVERVLQRLGGRSLEDVVTRVVLETAERMVREEIERLKAVARG